VELGSNAIGIASLFAGDARIPEGEEVASAGRPGVIPMAAML
jgi:hypothetical protein